MSRILVVEDEAHVAEVIADALAESHHDARVAATASDAVMMAGMERPDAILLDMNLPDALGTATLDRLRQVRPDVPIIMLTANADEALARHTLMRGAFDYITKPFDLDHLTDPAERGRAACLSSLFLTGGVAD